MSRKLNIRPSTGVYATYKHLRYDPWTAIAEFVDNSTQSYYDNQEKLERIKYWKGLKVDIKYEKDEDGSMSLVIRDNAYGMDYRDFQRAIVLDSPPNRPTRSELKPLRVGLVRCGRLSRLSWAAESDLRRSSMLTCCTNTGMRKSKSRKPSAVKRSMGPLFEYGN